MTHCSSRQGWHHAGRVAALATATGLGLAVTTLAAPAWAHDSLISSTPEADEVLETSPEEILLEFSGDGLTTGDAITNVIIVTDDHGESWEGDSQVDGSTMTAELAADMPGGEYTVAYRVAYSDGHAEEQAFDFEIAESEVEAESAEAPPSQDDGQAKSTEVDEPLAADSATETQEDSGVPVWLTAVGGVAVLALAAGITVAILRGRRKRHF